MGSITFTNLTRAVEIGANSYLLQIGAKRVVLDSGLHPRMEGEAALPNHDLLADNSVDAIVVSHAHQDHVGSLPVLMRRQRRAPVFMTEGTRALSEVMLHNSVNVMLKKRDEGVVSYPLFTHREIDINSRRFSNIPVRQRFDLNGERLSPNENVDIEFEFFDAGHILGSTGTLIRADGRTIFYTGDVNFDAQTLMQAATFPEEPLDVLIMETTRGDRATPEGFTRAGEELRLAEAFRDAFERGGCVLLPLFALGKTQEMLALFYEFRRSGLLPRDCPIYIGGLGTKLTELHDRLAPRSIRQRRGLQLLDEVAPFVVGGQDAQTLPMKAGRIYALSSGMMSEKTLSNTVARLVLSEPNHSLIFVGYADPASPAGKIRSAEPGETVQLSAEMPPQKLRCRVDKFNFSGHSSRESLRAYANKVRPKKIVLVHGDVDAMNWFREVLSTDLPGTEIITPTPGEPIEF
ncbi:MAG: Ribonuclease [Chthoniobacteraceae bacterium]|nr:Ribonuclease [Chthoniobacteraceae bacterium]